MYRATLNRLRTSNEGTFGVILTDTGYTCQSGELPWRDNTIDLSCVPPGEYWCVWSRSPAHGMCYRLQGVLGRHDIEIHVANFCGDTAMGFLCDLRGCIAPGMTVGQLNGQTAVLASYAALTALEQALDYSDFLLSITEHWEAP